VLTTQPRSRAQLHPADPGFSFVELLAYMAIAALLILAAIPQFSNYRGQARDQETLSDVRNVALAIEAWAIDHPGETYPFVNVDWDAGNPTHNLDVLTANGVKVAPGTHMIIRDRLQYIAAAAPGDALGQDYCIVAYNPQGRKYRAESSAVQFSSRDGGLGEACRDRPTAPSTGAPGSPAGAEAARDDFIGTGDILGQLSSTGKPWEGTAGMFLQEGGRAIGQARSGYVTTEAPASTSRTVTVKDVRLDTSPRASASQVLVYTNHVTRGRTLFMFLNVDAKGGARWGLWELTSGKSAAVLDAGVLKLEPNTVNTFDMSVTTTGKSFTIAAAGQTRTGTLSDATYEALKSGNGFGIGGSPLMPGVSFDSISATSNPQ